MSSAEQEERLVRSLTSFIRLQTSCRPAAARLHEAQDDVSESQTVRVLFPVVGGVLGAACGAVCGGVFGAFGGVGATTYNHFCGSINAVSASAGFVSSVLGGVVGGVSGGVVGSAVGAAAESMGRPVGGVVCSVAWLTIGYATGRAIGGIFGGSVGAAGGGIGGAAAALCATKCSVSLVKVVVGRFCETKQSEAQKMKLKTINVMQKTGDFREEIKPLLEELKTLRTICEKTSCAEVHGLLQQTQKTLTAAAALEETISAARRAADLPRFISSVEKAARQSEKIATELQTTREEAQKCLDSLKKPN